VLSVFGQYQNSVSLDGKGCEVRVREQMFGGGIIADGREVILLLGQEREEEAIGLAIWSDHIGLARFAKNYFDYLWADTKSAKDNTNR
jgi:hypothetical protein